MAKSAHSIFDQHDDISVVKTLL